jgi:hypothetical protein
LQVLRVPKQLTLHGLNTKINGCKIRWSSDHFICSRTHATTCSGLNGLMK